MNSTALKRKLKAARAENGYTQAQLAKKLKCAQNSISLWEKDISSARFKDVVHLCRLLGLDISDIEKDVT